MSNPFQCKGRWFKGNLHTHTTGSDGDLPAAEMARKYREAGYDFLAITDHNVVTSVDGLSDEGFLVLPGEEIDVGRLELVLVNINETIPPRDGDDVGALLRRVREQGGIAHLPHPRTYNPARDGIIWREEAVIQGVYAMEVYNTSVEANCGKGEAGAIWDEVLEMGRRLHGVAADDSHYHFNDRRPNDTACSCVMVRAETLSAQAIVEALLAGRFYASTGLLIDDIRVTETQVTVTCPAARTITAICDKMLGRRHTLLEKPISPATFDIHDETRYLRIECEAPDGTRAWTNALVWQ